MKCPICGNEMEKGLVQAGQRVLWSKKRHYFSLLPKEGEVTIGYNPLGNVCFESYICKSCKRVILDYSEADFEEK